MAHVDMNCVGNGCAMLAISHMSLAAAVSSKVRHGGFRADEDPRPFLQAYPLTASSQTQADAAAKVRVLTGHRCKYSDTISKI